MIGITLMTVPTIFGGLTVLGVLTSGAAGMPRGPELTPPNTRSTALATPTQGVLVVFRSWHSSCSTMFSCQSELRLSLTSNGSEADWS